MAAEPNLEVHDAVITQRIDLGLNGAAQRKTRVTFYVGTHGPFVIDYNTTEFTPEKVRADMAAMVKTLREIVL